MRSLLFRISATLILSTTLASLATAQWSGSSYDKEAPPPPEIPNPLDDPNLPELIAAVRGGDPERALALLEGETEVDVRDDLGRTALMYAASQMPGLVEKLIAAGADVNAEDTSGNTALFFFPEADDPTAALVLLRLGARVDATNRLGHRPIRGAALLGHTAILERLLAAGVPAKGEAGRDALTQAVTHGHFAAAAILLEAGAEIDENKGRDGRGLLYLLAEKGDEPAVRFLVEHGATVDTRVAEKPCCIRETPLMAAVREGHAETAKTLIEHGADLEAVSERGFTPLLLAARENQPELALLLLAHGAPIDGLGSEETESTPLLFAALEGRVEVMRVLLDKGANVHARNRSGATPFMFAAAQGNAEMATLLLEHGAKIEATNYSDATALHLAVFNQRPEMVKFLLDKGAPLGGVIRIEGFGRVGPLGMAIGRDDPEVVRILLEHGADPNETVFIDELSRVTPLMLAASRGHSEVVQALLSAGADPNATQRNGETALDQARKNDHTEVVELLSALVHPGE